MKVKEIIELIDFISKSELNEVKVETEEIKLSVKKEATVETRFIEHPMHNQSYAQMSHQAAPVAQAAPQAVEAPVAVAAPAKPKGVPVKSPMIGTFYRSTSPESPMFVNVGDRVEVGQTVCIVEAMKLFNEIESEVSGTIIQVCVENANPVEYDQPLFIVDPD